MATPSTRKTRLQSRQWSCSDLVKGSEKLHAVKKEEFEDDPELTDELLKEQIRATHLKDVFFLTELLYSCITWTTVSLLHLRPILTLKYTSLL